MASYRDDNKFKKIEQLIRSMPSDKSSLDLGHLLAESKYRGLTEDQVIKLFKSIPAHVTSLDLSHLFFRYDFSVRQITRILGNIPPHVTSIDLSYNHLRKLLGSQPKKLVGILETIPKNVHCIDLRYNNLLKVGSRRELIMLLSVIVYFSKNKRLELADSVAAQNTLETLLPKEPTSSEQKKIIVAAAKNGIHNFYEKQRERESKIWTLFQVNSKVERAKLLESYLDKSLDSILDPQVIINEFLNDPDTKFGPDSLATLLLDELLQIEDSPWLDNFRDKSAIYKENNGYRLAEQGGAGSSSI
ncbi:hypothetical protein ACQUW5_06935 [Legionella sp. CNM-1927-20]|uniref:hypothetical protein n=1 Tax=Legionella sp. CNM-1927-20 TaxID=3422221 RepID=UPI00403AA84B